MLVETGGRVRFINRIASEWFELAEGETPNIERLSRRVRPGEGFLEICAAEGQARFSVNGRLVDAVSYHVPGPVPSVLVALRRAENVLNLSEGEQDNLPATALRSISEFGQAIASSLSMETTVESILTNVERLVASDFI